MNITVLDLELTQNQQSSPQIIQIGAVRIDMQTGRLLSAFGLTANPGELPCTFIEALTGISPAVVSASLPLAEVLRKFWDWFEEAPGHQRIIATWGRGDIPMLMSSSKERGVAIPQKAPRELDFKVALSPLFAMSGLPAGKGLANSLSFVQLTFIGREHDAVWDAYNTARILLHTAHTYRKGYGKSPMRVDLIDELESGASIEMVRHKAHSKHPLSDEEKKHVEVLRQEKNRS